MNDDEIDKKNKKDKNQQNTDFINSDDGILISKSLINGKLPSNYDKISE